MPTKNLRLRPLVAATPVIFNLELKLPLSSTITNVPQRRKLRARPFPCMYGWRRRADRTAERQARTLWLLLFVLFIWEGTPGMMETRLTFLLTSVRDVTTPLIWELARFTSRNIPAAAVKNFLAGWLVLLICESILKWALAAALRLFAFELRLFALALTPASAHLPSALTAPRYRPLYTTSCASCRCNHASFGRAVLFSVARDSLFYLFLQPALFFGSTIFPTFGVAQLGSHSAVQRGLWAMMALLAFVRFMCVTPIHALVALHFPLHAHRRTTRHATTPRWRSRFASGAGRSAR